MKHLLLAAILLSAVPLCHGQTSSSGGTPITGPTNPPGMSSNPNGNVGITPVPNPNSPTGNSPAVTPFPGSSIGSVGTGPGATGSSVGQTIQSQPLPPTPPPTEPSTLGGTTLQPGVLGSAPASPGVIGTRPPAAPCVGSVGSSSCQEMQ